MFINSIICVLISVYVIISLKKVVNTELSFFNRMYLLAFTSIHFAVSIVFAFYLNKFTTINDPHDFYVGAQLADSWFKIFGFGHQFISFIIYPFVKLKVSIEVLFLVFATISFKGFLEYFDLIGFNNLTLNNSIVWLFFLLPTLHFWTGFLGKEALLLYAMVMILKSIKFNRFNWSFYSLLLLIFFIRPHVFFVLMLVFLTLLFLDRETSRKLKNQLIVIVIVAVLLLLPIAVLYFLKVESLNIESLQSYITGFLNYTENKGSTAISLAETNFLTRVFYLVFMPLPFIYDIKNNLQLIAAFENCLFLIIVLYVIYNIIKNRFNYQFLRLDHKFAIIASLFLIALFASYLYNLGLGNRMRIMFLPYLFYFLISGLIPVKNIRRYKNE